MCRLMRCLCVWASVCCTDDVLYFFFLSRQVDKNMGKAHNELESTNKNLDETLKEQAAQNACVYLICCIVLVGVLMVGYNLIKSATGDDGKD